MKFAKEIEKDLVPEWRAKYFDYKTGKKKIKAVIRALHDVDTGGTPSSRFSRQLHRQRTASDTITNEPSATNPLRTTPSASRHVRYSEQGGRPPMDAPQGKSGESQPLRSGEGPGPRRQGMTRYGSIVGSPPNPGNTSTSSARGRYPPSLMLPDPALDPDDASSRGPRSAPNELSGSGTVDAKDGNAFKVGDTISPVSKKNFLTRRRSLFVPKRANSTPDSTGSRPWQRRLMSFAGPATTSEDTASDVQLGAYRMVELRTAEFHIFLDKELDKIEDFYKQKEDEATKRLAVLREQLHILRDRRLEELLEMQAAKLRKQPNGLSRQNSPIETKKDIANGEASQETSKWTSGMDRVVNSLNPHHIGSRSKAMNELGTPEALRGQQPFDERRDFSRRPVVNSISYKAAKRKLKTGLAEYYRGLELLKSYALLNRTAFRKINKKFDKAVNARPPLRYMNEKVNTAWFVQSDVLEGHIRTVEDLYARYFERGNHKVAVGKLRRKTAASGDYSVSSFRDGLLLAAALVFGIEGLVYGAGLLFSDDDQLSTVTSYLLQIYAGYFLMLLLVLFYCLACKFWVDNKINYVFVFEFDTHHHLDWRQMSELPCLCLFLLGLSLWLNFSRYGGDAMFTYYPVILIGLTVILILFPLRTLYYRTRLWFTYSNWRLFWAGLYPVEFRDFFLGDMFCSQAYAMGNIELFFCLYANDWRNPSSCNSSNSRLLGFFSTLPGIWRALQCLRRYYDTRNVFPHLVNCGKYCFTILYYLSLSTYRMNKNNHLRAFFIFCAVVNSVYCSVWDLVMDWSLLDPTAEPRFLRAVLGYKRRWIYYAAMFIDPILRFNWIFYAIYIDDVQHSAILSFLIGFSEVCRRGIWMLFRVENEHCTNVGRFRASRDVPLPYDMPSPSSIRTTPDAPTPADRTPSERPSDLQQTATKTSGADLEAQRTHSTIRRRQTPKMAPTTPKTGLSRVGTALHMAHAQDFERRRKPEVGKNENGSESDDDDDDDGDDGEADDIAEVRKSEDSDPESRKDALKALDGSAGREGRERSGGAGPSK